MAERSPISYVDRVTAPILFLAGEHDTRCPLRQVLLYTDRLAARGHDHELYLFATGHAPFQIEERIKQTGIVLDFLGSARAGDQAARRDPGRGPGTSLSVVAIGMPPAKYAPVGPEVTRSNVAPPS